MKEREREGILPFHSFNELGNTTLDSLILRAMSEIYWIYLFFC